MDKNNEAKSIFDDAPVVTIVGGNDKIGLEETISVDSNGNVDPISLDYNEYRSMLTNMYINSTEEDSIISTFNFQDNKCEHTLKVKFADGREPTTKKKEFDVTENFRNNFLIPIVDDFCKYNEVFDSSVEVVDRDNCNFVARTNKNDCLCVSNINIELANKLKDLFPKQEIKVSDAKTLVKINNKGIGNYLVIILTVIAIGIALVGTIYFTIVSQ